MEFNLRFNFFRTLFFSFFFFFFISNFAFEVLIVNMLDGGEAARTASAVGDELL